MAQFTMTDEGYQEFLGNVHHLTFNVYQADRLDRTENGSWLDARKAKANGIARDLRILVENQVREQMRIEAGGKPRE